jgi:Holliday junction resolvasome RuvABC endonuclease subunit
MKIKVMGIDAAFTNIGLALATVDLTDPANPVVDVIDLHLIHTAPMKKRPRGMPRSADDMRRAREAVNGIHEHIAKWQPDIIVAEVPFGSQSARASWALGIALGVLASIPDLVEVTPMEVKAMSGEKHADKDWMIEWAMDLHPNAPWVTRKLKGNIVQVAGQNEHLADAVGAIYAGLSKRKPK